jgi:hypothetical protein
MPENFRGLTGLQTTCQVLQLATRRKTFLFDLQQMMALREMDEVLLDVFDSETTLKVGMVFDTDMHKLRNDFPSCACFQVRTGMRHSARYR